MKLVFQCLYYPHLLFISVKPDPLQLSPSTKVYEQEIGGSLSVYCSVNSELGVPVGNLSWIHESNPPKIIQSVQVNRLVLSFIVTKREDGGNYTCNASNAIGEATPVGVTLKVLGKLHRSLCF